MAQSHLQVAHVEDAVSVQAEAMRPIRRVEQRLDASTNVLGQLLEEDLAARRAALSAEFRRSARKKCSAVTVGRAAHSSSSVSGRGIREGALAVECCGSSPWHTGFFFELDFEGTDLLLMGLGQEGDREGEVVS